MKLVNKKVLNIIERYQMHIASDNQTVWFTFISRIRTSFIRNPVIEEIRISILDRDDIWII